MNSAHVPDYYNNATTVTNIDLILFEVKPSIMTTNNFTRYNLEQITSVAFQYRELYNKLISNFYIVTLLTISTLTNIILLLINCRQRHNRKRLRLSVFIAHLGFINVFVSVGLIMAVFTSEILRNQIYSLNYSTVKGLTYAFLREFIRDIIGEKFAYLQSFFLLFISVERYLSLFPNYSPSFSSSKWLFALMAVTYLFLLVGVDHRLLVALFGPGETTSICIALLLVSTLLAFAFDVSALVHLRCQQHLFYRNHDISFATALLLVLVLQITGQVFITLELVHHNFAVDYVINSLEQSSDGLNQIFNILYKIGHYLFVLSPLYISLILLTLVHQHRKAVVCGIRHLLRPFSCLGIVEKVDYSSETMRSILAEQTKSKSLRMFPPTTQLGSRTRQAVSAADKV